MIVRLTTFLICGALMIWANYYWLVLHNDGLASPMAAMFVTFVLLAVMGIAILTSASWKKINDGTAPKSTKWAVIVVLALFIGLVVVPPLITFLSH